MDNTNTLDAKKIVQSLRETFDTGKTKPLEWRERNLRALLTLAQENEDRICEAAAKDLGKPKFEAMLGEVKTIQGDVTYLLSNVSTWMRPTYVSTPLVQIKGLSSCEIHPQPLGVVLVIGAWNYPFTLSVQPLAGAIAAGNCVLVKPSEVSPHSSALLAELIPKYLDNDCVKVVEGGVAETTEILKQKFDHIFYTGNGAVGKIVMRAAAEHLTPVTLELGGKSPCIVEPDADLDVTSRRIAAGKFMNCGQTCIAPDYVLVNKAVEEPFINKLKETVKSFYGDNAKESKDYCRIVNTRHVERLKALLKDTGEKATVVIGGDVDESDRYISPTIIKDVDANSKLMQEEIFGPILPIISYTKLEEAISFINARPKPLALYLFSFNKPVINQVLEQTTSGGACINETVLHVTVHDLPFGGVGESGQGSYHGKASFDCFSHHRSVLNKTTYLDFNLRYPPYTESKMATVMKLL
eukprot:TRINITY_DN2525_c0_g1_i2.p1 TRINITY_DN2525_c0_g1~~TRINITY_DN2525_c0_g1_i2.p1  ORF type:complete len:468 (-),score=153.94 TRINITY_DN2525_c0_g1_i2:88-1491(-)